MKLSCPSCGAKYSIADEKVQDRLAKIRCRKCSATIIVDGKVEPPSVYTSEGGAAPGADVTESSGGGGGGEYSVDFGDNDQRSMTADDIAQAYRRGELTADMYVWAEGMSDWQPISAVPELAEALNAGAAVSAQQRAAARTGSGRGSAHDLFGGIDKAGSEEDVMTSAPQAGGAAAAAQGVATGARNESSVLFSLSALTASAPAAAPPMRSTFSAASDNKGDDSGLIDLRALTSTAGSQPPAGPLGLGTAPLGMAAPLGGMTAPAMHHSEGPAPKAQSSKTGLYIGGAIVMVGALIAGAIVMTANKDTASAVPPPVAPTVAMPAAAPPPAPEAKKDEPTAQPPATGTAAPDQAPSAAAAPTKTASAPRPTYGGGAAAHIARAKSSSSSSSGSSGSSSEKSAPAAAAFSGSSDSNSGSSSDSSGGEKKKKKKAASSCNCSPGDLMCAMKCASQSN